MKLNQSAYRLKATFVEAIDADTYLLHIDLPFHLQSTQRIRLLYVNCPERRTGEPHAKALAFVLKWFEDNPVFYVTTYLDREEDNFGRLLAIIENADGERLSAEIIKRNLGVPFRDPVVDRLGGEDKHGERLGLQG